MNMAVSIHPSQQPQGRSQSPGFSLVTSYTEQDKHAYVLLRDWKADIVFATFQGANGYLALPSWEGFLWLCSLPRMVIVLGGMEGNNF